MIMKKAFVLGLATLASALLSSPASAANLVLNGDFSSATNGFNKQLNNTATLGNSTYTALNDWTLSGSNGVGLNILVAPGWNANGAKTQYDNDFRIWDKLHPSDTTGSNGFTDAPGGKNYIVADGASSYTAKISQVIGGLTAGQDYTVSFDWATGQQMKGTTAFNGPTWNKGWNVTFGSATQQTDIIKDVEHGFSSGLGGNINGVETTGLGTWMHTTMTFTATAASQTLTFLAQGSPDGVPPFLMLANVSMEAVPEPSAVVMMGLGVAGLAGLGLRRRNAR